MTRDREWGTETDLDSLIYGNGPWPERRLVYTCSNKNPFNYDTVTFKAIPTKDECVLKEIVIYTYAVAGPSLVSPRIRIRAGVRIRQGSLALDALGPEARTVVLLDPSGRILSRSPVANGAASAGLPSRSGIALWSVLDGSGRRLAAGSVVLP